MTKPAGLGQKSRTQLGRVMKAARGTITPTLAAKSLGLSQNESAQLLSRWATRGWLTRIKRGVYVPVPLEAESTEIAIAEPWLLAKALFSPCYIGGWSAAEYWDLTEQIFHSIVVITIKKVHQRDLRLRSARFRIKTVVERALFGTKPVWINDQKVEVSDPTRTMLDILNDPSLGGGIRSCIDFFSNYMNSGHKDLSLLIKYAKQLENGTVYKRLGFILEKNFSDEVEAIQECRRFLPKGYSQLDPQVPSKRLVTSWNLWVPESLLSKRATE